MLHYSLITRAMNTMDRALDPVGPLREVPLLFIQLFPKLYPSVSVQVAAKGSQRVIQHQFLIFAVGLNIWFLQELLTVLKHDCEMNSVCIREISY